MRLDPLRSWGFSLTLALFLPSLLSAQGVVVENVATAAALEQAGARGGDVFRAWTRPAHPPPNPEPASGILGLPFHGPGADAQRARRGAVELRVESRREPLVL